MTVAAVAAVPAAPLLLPTASSAQPPAVAGEIARLRATVDTALTSLPEVDAVLLVAPGDGALLHDAVRATLAGYGLPAVATDLEVDTELLAAVATGRQAVRVRSEQLDGDLAVLALLVAAARPGIHVLPVSAPTGAGDEALTALATGFVGGVTAAGRTVAVVASGDLAATLDTTSPGYLVAGASEWDAAAVDAVRRGDATELAALGPQAAARVQARGWAPLVVLLHVAAQAGLVPTDVDYLAPCGVGQLVAR